VKKALVQLRFGLAMALGGITSNKLRSFLTLLGVMIGVASVVSLVAIGEGARLAITRQFESLGTNIIRVETHRWDARLNLEDAAALEARVPTLVAAMPVVRTDVQVKWRRAVSNCALLGVNEKFPVVRDHEVAAGRFISHLDVTERLRVAVVGDAVIDQVFGGRNPLGEGVYIGGQRFTIIGVLTPKGTGMAGEIDDKILVPVTTAQRLTLSTRVHEIWAKARDRAATEVALVQLSRYFRHRFHIQDTADGEGDSAADGPIREKFGYYPGPGRYYGRPGYYPGHPGFDGPGLDQPLVTVTSVNELVQEANEAKRVMTLMLGGIAGVSLLVGGLGIMNIMLVSVAERTREIGLRKALGARTWDLIYQFLMEALLLCAAGGLCGLGLGKLGADLFARYGMETVITAQAAWVALLAALIVGLVFGVYPAYSAASLQPVEALRRE